MHRELELDERLVEVQASADDARALATSLSAVAETKPEGGLPRKCEADRLMILADVAQAPPLPGCPRQRRAHAPSLAPVSVHSNVVRCHERHVAELASVVCCAAGCTPRRGARAPVCARVRFGVNAAAFVVATCDRDAGRSCRAGRVQLADCAPLASAFSATTVAAAPKVTKKVRNARVGARRNEPIYCRAPCSARASRPRLLPRVPCAEAPDSPAWRSQVFFDITVRRVLRSAAPAPR